MPLTRRTLLAMFAAAAVRPARGQSPRHRIGWISTDVEPDPFIDGFREGLRQRGWVDGQNLDILVHYSPGNAEGLKDTIARLIRSNVSFIVSSGPAIQAIRATTEIPVLFAISGDPIAAGIAKSLARPGQNFTGSTFLSLEIAAKRVELLKETVPPMRKLGVLSNTRHPGEQSELGATRQAASVLGLELSYVPFDGARELDRALGALRDARPDAVVTFPDGVTMARRTQIAQFLAVHSLPSMFGWSEHCEAGGLMSYGANQRDTYVDLAGYADRMLRGEKPADLPIKQPTRFELVLNLSTARLLRLEFPQSVAVRANRTVE